ncbi:hypothetical protein [Nocardioides sp. R-C-SC26]|uniref:hypothetical protein n=1 Tax=Nocardioides sp. R-C-SC26 TaxID=2870414 RepID=UPI001E653B5E|nr:hypothetical protein [Nocardioides sp. R-C-SC26]
MSDDDLGPRPEPQIEPGEPDPGGPDAVPFSDGFTGDGEDDGAPLVADLDPADNPAVEDALPDEMRQPEDTSTQATRDEDGESDVDQEEESPA